MRSRCEIKLGSICKTRFCLKEKATYRIMRRWPIPSTAGATNAKKSDGVIQDGTAKTPSMIPSVSSMGVVSDISATLASSSSGVGLLEPSRKT